MRGSVRLDHSVGLAAVVPAPCVGRSRRAELRGTRLGVRREPSVRMWTCRLCLLVLVHALCCLTQALVTSGHLRSQASTFFAADQ